MYWHFIDKNANMHTNNLHWSPETIVGNDPSFSMQQPHCSTAMVSSREPATAIFLYLIWVAMSLCGAHCDATIEMAQLPTLLKYARRACVHSLCKVLTCCFFERRLCLLRRVLLWSGTGLLQRVVHNAAHHLPGPAPQHLHGHLRDRHLRVHPQPHLLLLLHQVRGNNSNS